MPPISPKSRARLFQNVNPAWRTPPGGASGTMNSESSRAGRSPAGAPERTTAMGPRRARSRPGRGARSRRPRGRARGGGALVSCRVLPAAMPPSSARRSALRQRPATRPRRARRLSAYTQTSISGGSMPSVVSAVQILTAMVRAVLERLVQARPGRCVRLRAVVAVADHDRLRVEMVRQDVRPARAVADHLVAARSIVLVDAGDLAARHDEQVVGIGANHVAHRVDDRAIRARHLAWSCSSGSSAQTSISRSVAQTWWPNPSASSEVVMDRPYGIAGSRAVISVRAAGDYDPSMPARSWVGRGRLDVVQGRASRRYG